MTFAQFVGDGNTGILGAINTAVIPTLLAIGFLIYVGGITYYFFLHGHEEAKREEGRKFAFWGIIGLSLLFGVWAVVNIMLTALGIQPAA